MANDLLSAIYDAPMAACPWSNALPLLQEQLAAERLMLKLAPARDAPGIIFTGSGESLSGPLRPYTETFQYKDPVSYMRMQAGELYHFDDLIDRRTLIESEYYRKFCSNFDIEHAFFCALGNFGGVEVLLSGSRGAAAKKFSLGELSLVRDLLPHLQRAAKFSCHIERYRLESNIYAKTLDALGVATLLIDCDSNIVRSSLGANALLSDHPEIRRIGNKIQIDGQAGRDFYNAMKKLSTGSDGEKHHIVLGASDAPIDLVVKKTPERSAYVTGRPQFIVYLNRPTPTPPEHFVAFVADALQLTPAEARLAVFLATGLSLRQAATALGITEVSARTYCKRVMGKIGVSRQAEMIKLVSGKLDRLARLA